MNKSLIKAAIAGGIAMFIWMTISWTVLPWHRMTFSTFHHPEKVAEVLKENAPQGGIFHGDCLQKPCYFVAVGTEAKIDMTMPMVKSLIEKLIAAFIGAWLLFQTKGMSYRRRVGFVTILGLLAGITAIVPFWTWWSFPCGYTLVTIADITIAWFFAGLIMAKLIKR